MSKMILILFATLTIASGYLTYKGIGLQGVTSQDTTQKSSHSYRSSSSSSWSGSSNGGFRSGK